MTGGQRRLAHQLLQERAGSRRARERKIDKWLRQGYSGKRVLHFIMVPGSDICWHLPPFHL